MRVRSAQFVASVLRPQQQPADGRPEVAFAGRSNVGKSSLINTLVGRKGLAKTSGRPGKTQTINFFDIDERFYIVDLPGYGFARVPVTVKEKWGRVVTGYIRNREPLKLVVMLVDARHRPTERDREMLALLDEAQVPTLIVATKIDKVKRGQRAANLRTIRKTLDLDDDAAILPCSATSTDGLKEIWNIVQEAVGAEDACR